MTKSDITDAMRRCIVREPALKQPVAKPMDCPIPESRSPAKVPAETLHGQIQAKPKYDDHPDHSAQDSEPQRPVRDEPLGPNQGEKAHSSRVRLRVCSHRRRLIDPDNLCPKYFIDLCRYQGLISDDTAADIELTVSQTKVAKGEQERTVITIEYPDSRPGLRH